MAKVYQLLVPGVIREGLDVLSFEASERLSHWYDVDVDVAVMAAERELAGELIGRRALFVMDVEGPTRVFHGMISEAGMRAYQNRGSQHEGSQLEAYYRIRLVPRFWLLTQRFRSRVFQDKTVQEVVQQVLAEAGIPTLWMLHQKLPKRDYCTQYQETDAAFVQRLAAEAGIFFQFLQPPAPAEGIGALLQGLGGAVVDGLGQAAGITDALGQAGGASDVLGPAAGVMGALGQTVGVRGAVGEVMVFGDDALAYRAIGDWPAGLDELLRKGLAELDRLAGGAITEAVDIAGDVVDTASGISTALGGPSFSAVLPAAPSRTLHFRPDAGAMVQGDRDAIHSLTLRDAVRTDRSSYRLFDPRRPLANLGFHDATRASGSSAGAAGIAGQIMGVANAAGDAIGAIKTAADGGDALTAVAQVGGAVAQGIGVFRPGLGQQQNARERYEHHDAFLWPDWDYAATEPKRILRSERRDQRLAHGDSPCPLLTPGGRFQLGDHPIGWVNREYAVVEVQHRGHAHRGRAQADDAPIYANRFRCVPADVPFLPPRPRARSVQACLTATVVGSSADSDLHTRGMAEVKVRFHWDREGHGTCWIRTMQAWSGAGWGAQFMPRAGMEVVVGFDGGDPDKPIVLGCVYNGTHPTPFHLPDQQSRSGIRTSSTPGGAGANELSFEDRRGEEQVFIHAERNFDTEVENDRSMHVMRDDSTQVDHDQALTVANQQRVRVEGGQQIHVETERRLVVEGPHEIVTRGDRVESVTGTASEAIGSSLERQIGGGLSERIGGSSVRRTAGSVVELVGSHEAPRGRSVRVEGKSQLSSAALNEISSDKELVLRVGKSSIRITDERIELSSPEVIVAGKDTSAKLAEGDITLLAKGKLYGIADKILHKSSGAGLGLTSEAKLDGSSILLNSPASASDSLEVEEKEPTKIELKDQDGNPLPYERYRIELEDGSAITGVLDENGKAEIMLDSGGEVTFPDLAEVSEG